MAQSIGQSRKSAMTHRHETLISGRVLRVNGLTRAAVLNSVRGCIEEVRLRAVSLVSQMKG